MCSNRGEEVEKVLFQIKMHLILPLKDSDWLI